MPAKLFEVLVVGSRKSWAKFNQNYAWEYEDSSRTTEEGATEAAIMGEFVTEEMLRLDQPRRKEPRQKKSTTIENDSSTDRG